MHAAGLVIHLDMWGQVTSSNPKGITSTFLVLTWQESDIQVTLSHALGGYWLALARPAPIIVTPSRQT